MIHHHCEPARSSKTTHGMATLTTSLSHPFPFTFPLVLHSRIAVSTAASTRQSYAFLSFSFSLFISIRRQHIHTLLQYSLTSPPSLSPLRRYITFCLSEFSVLSLWNSCPHRPPPSLFPLTSSVCQDGNSILAASRNQISSSSPAIELRKIKVSE